MKELIQASIKFFPEHITYLKTISENNIAEANRQCIDRCMNRDKKEFINPYLTIISIGFIFLHFSIISGFRFRVLFHS